MSSEWASTDSWTVRALLLRRVSPTSAPRSPSGAKSVRWTAAACQLTDPQVPIDAGGGPCAQVKIAPKKGSRGATVEIYFEGYDKDGPGSAFAFRSFTKLADYENYSRTTGGFEYDWRSTHEPGWRDPDGGLCGE